MVGKKGHNRMGNKGGEQISGVYLTKPKPNFVYRPKEKKKESVNRDNNVTTSSQFGIIVL